VVLSIVIWFESWNGEGDMCLLCACLAEERRNVGNFTPRLNREQSVTSTVAPAGSGKEIEYFFASDARYVHLSD